MQVKSSSSQNQADIYTFICIISFAILAFLTANLPSGMEALYIIIPMFIVGLVHLVLGPMALIAALSTGKHRRNSWVYLYFGGLILFLTLISGLSNAMYQRARGEFEGWQYGEQVILVDAVSRNAHEEIGNVLAAGADASFCFTWLRDYRDYSPLQHALRSGSHDAVDLLLKTGADVDLTCNPTNSRDSIAPILISAERLDHRSIQALIEYGANPNPEARDITLLGMVLAGGNYSLPYNGAETRHHQKRRDINAIRGITRLLIDAGADVHAQHKWAPLHWALVLGDRDLLGLLLDAGADPNQAETQHGRAPLTLALTYDQLELARLLLTNVPPARIDGLSGLSALHAAAEQKNNVAVQMLLDAGLDFTPILDQDLKYAGGRAVDLVNEVLEAMNSNDDLLLQALLSAGVDINRPIQRKQGRVLTGLVAHDVSMLKKAISLGGNVNARNSAGATSLHYYAGCSRCSDPVTAMQNLLDVGADINALDTRGETPLRKAEIYHVRDTTVFLTERGALRSISVENP